MTKQIVSMGKKYPLILLIVSQLIVILILGKKIYIDRANTLGISINIDNGDTGGETRQNPNSTLKHFYEPEADTIVDEAFPWDPTKKITTSINSDTLHNIEIDITSKPNIIAMGDSFTYGEFVSRKDNWVSLLNEQMGEWKKMRVVNFGVEGYDIEYSVERFRIRGPKYDPHLVIWFLKSDDFISIAERLSPIVDEEKKIFKKTEMKDQSELVIPKKGTDNPAYVSRALERYMKSFGGIRKIYEYQDRKLRSLRDYYKGPVIVMHLDLKDEHKKILDRWAAEDKNIYLFQLPSLTMEESFPDSHPNEKGHKVIAAKLLEFLKRNASILKRE